MRYLILILGICAVVCLAAEKKAAAGHRRAFLHVIHVNGTRGKSAVTRLIAAGLSEGGLRVWCKTTGTIPMYITPEGEEIEIHRRGAANIREQLWAMKQAAASGAQILVVECMALDPELQYVSEHKMLRSDIGVITNARVDHVAEMGSSVEAVCEALSNTIPENGTLFTADARCYPLLREAAALQGTQTHLTAVGDMSFPGHPLFPENYALALAVCEACGVSREEALRGMNKVKEDPFTASLHPLVGGALLLNGMSANDPASTALLPERMLQLHPELQERRTIILLNCRSDRGYRTNLMLDYIRQARPEEVWLMGSGAHPAYRRLIAVAEKAQIGIESGRPAFRVQQFRAVEDLPLHSLENPSKTLVYAIGNIAGEGVRLISKLREEEQACTVKS